MDWLNPYRWLLALFLIAAVMVGVPVLVKRYDAHQQDIGYQRRAVEDRVAADAQTERNRELGRLVEMHYHVLADAREKFFAKVATEVHDAAAPLSACPVPEPVRVRINAAIECASGDSPTACGAAVQVPGP